MTAGWVAGSVRARVLADRRIGADAGRRIAVCGSLTGALAMLDSTAYRVEPDRVTRDTGDPQQVLAAAQRAISEALLWDLRVLAGWLPHGGTALMRVLAGWFEIANVSERLRDLEGGGQGEYFELGALATAWPQLQLAGSPVEMRTILVGSAWRDPGGETALALEVGLRARWAQRAASLGEPVSTWAASAVALLLAGERFSAQNPENPVLRSVASALLGRTASATTAVGDLAAAIPDRLSWVFGQGASAADIWRNEAIWWARVERDGLGLLGRSGFDHRPVVGAAAVLAADARRVSAALEIAARGGGVEVFDVVA